MHKKNKYKRRTIVWGTIACLILLLAIAGPMLGHHDPYAMDLANSGKAPTKEYIMGTDALGRCICCRLLEGAFRSIFSAILVVMITFTFGTAIGLTSGYLGGTADIIIMRLVDVVQSFPSLIFTICAAAVLGGGISNCILVMSLIGWTGYARLARSQVLALKERTFVQASRIYGMSFGQTLLNTILPNSLRPLVVSASTRVGSTILSFSGLSFLGLGTALPYPEWGAMLNDARDKIQVAPWAAIYPGLAIFVIVFVLGMFGDSLNEWLAPKQQG